MSTKKGMKMREEYYEGLANLSAESVEYVCGNTGCEDLCPKRGEFRNVSIRYRKDERFRGTVEHGIQNKMSLYEAISSSTAFFLKSLPSC